jgi:ferredoxin
LILTGEKATLAHESEGRISENLFNTLQVNAQGQAVLACGSNEFVEQAKTLLQEKAQSFQAEQFTPPVIQHNTAERVKVHLNRSGQTLDVSAGESLLNALEAAGLQPEYGCRMGICNTCACGKTAGITQNLLNQEISHDSTDALRLCISRATSDIALDL